MSERNWKGLDHRDPVTGAPFSECFGESVGVAENWNTDGDALEITE